LAFLEALSDLLATAAAENEAKFSIKDSAENETAST
jgi:hypothetical protein